MTTHSQASEPIDSVSSDQISQRVWRDCLQRHRLIAVIRASTVEVGVSMAKAAAEGGVHLIEVTWNSPQPVQLLQQIQRALPDCRVGVGTLLSVEALSAAIAAGAQFAFSPHTSLAMLNLAATEGIPLMPGAMTPTEVVTAWQAGAAAVKVFPISSLGGAAYIRSLQGPLGRIPLIPTGGVNPTTAPDLLRAGAIAVGLSSALFPKADIEAQNWSVICQRAQNLVRVCQIDRG
ncbi:MAG: bifunctional 4-hydroxy-2-oxoglutarate aldolase/2-dehydro-3-deoxy-phosphogluconate aldolase [Cyanobacteria bacterium P01_A01_bin.114]